MILSLIVAMSENRVIGRDNALPWHIPEDLKRFRRITSGHPVIMGRKTYESIGRLLPHRQNIIVTRNLDFSVPGATMAKTIESAIEPFKNTAEEVFILGGGQIFEQTIHRADRLYLTIVHETILGDVVFPEIPKGLLRETAREFHLGQPSYTFVDFEATR